MNPPPNKSAYASALRWLSQRDLTQQEIRTRLHRKGFDAEVIDAVISRLLSQNYVSDDRVARQVVETALSRSRQGPMAIRHKLRTRGVDGETADTTWRELTKTTDWLKIAEAIKERYDMNDPRQRARCARYLARQGFPSTVIATVLQWDETP